jgi:uncharacterized protein YcbX
MVTVSRLQIAPVKGLSVVECDRLHLDSTGVAEDRRLYLLAADGSVATLRQHPTLAAVRPSLDLATSSLRLDFPDGSSLSTGLDAVGEAVTATLYGRTRPGRVLGGELAEALSAYAGAPLRLVLHDGPGLGWDEGPATLVSRASMAALAPGDDHQRARRFRMLVEVDGPAAYAEDAWVGRQVRVGSAVLAVAAPLGRCVVVTRSPDHGRPDWSGLKDLVRIRGDVGLGVIADVLTPGTVRVGDPVEVLAEVAERA